PRNNERELINRPECAFSSRVSVPRTTDMLAASSLRVGQPPSLPSGSPDSDGCGARRSEASRLAATRDGIGHAGRRVIWVAADVTNFAEIDVMRKCGFHLKARRPPMRDRPVGIH